MFLENAVAMAGSDLSAEALNAIGTTDIVFVFDNEPRNKEILDRIDNTIERGDKVVIWPNNIVENAVIPERFWDV